MYKFSGCLLGLVATVHTNSNSITELRTIRNLNSRKTRLLLKLQDFNLKFVHLPGAENFVTDTLPRFPPDEVAKGEQQIHVNVVFADVSREEFADV